MIKFIAASKAGRCANGFQLDHGIVRHAIPAENWNGFGTKAPAICGTRPGRRSVGFVADKGLTEITCERCKQRLKKIEHEICDVDKNGDYFEAVCHG